MLLAIICTITALRVMQDRLTEIHIRAIVDSENINQYNGHRSDIMRGNIHTL